MTATERLRALLDERGVGWTTASGSACYTAWATERGIAQATDYGEDGGVLSVLFRCVPAQAIAATLGRGTCRDVGRYAFVCSECGWASDEPHHILGGFWPKYCPNCGREVVNDQ